MKFDIVRNLKRNLAAGMANKALMMALPFLNRTLFLWLLGPEYLGLNGLFASVLGVLSLAEMGFGAAVVCSMYKPVAEDDTAKIAAYLKFYRGAYRAVGTAVAAAGFALMPLLPRLISGEIPPGLDLRVLYLIHLFNTVISYFLFAYRGALLSAYQREDALSNIRSVVTLAQYIASMAVLVAWRSYMGYVAVTVIFTILNNLLIARTVKRLFPHIRCEGKLAPEDRKRVLGDVGAVFLHRIGSVVSYSADNLVVSSALGLAAVAVYGNYYYVYTAVGGVIYVFYNALTAGFGNAIALESVESVWQKFRKANFLSLVAVSWCVAVMVALYQPFMDVWTGGQEELMRPVSTAIWMGVYFYVNYSRQMLQTLKAGAGLWRQDRFKPVTAAAVNLALSLWWVRSWGLDGVIAATVVAFALIEIPWEIAVVFRHYFKGGERNYLREYLTEQGKFLVAVTLLTSVAWMACRACGFWSGIPGFLVRAAAAAGAAGAGVALIFRKRLLVHFVQVKSRASAR